VANNAKATVQPVGWARLLQHNDVLLAVGMVMIVAMMMVPLPSFILDILLTLNIALAITILLVTVYTEEPLQYSTFPTILLMATLFRLGLNVSSTRLILLHGEAGQVIHAFGNFVIGGNYVVGLLLFVILVIINFIVITNGAGRVSEVSARFTLDAMPGKQLSIDADLSSGMIDETTARKRRLNIQREADFYGTMDGASKFVKGDAIAAIIITVINIVGGLIIGVAQQGMPIMQAAATFTTLTVGEGLVAQMPALIISAATGVLVTRVSADDHTLGENIGIQMFSNPKIMGIMGVLLLLMGAIPGLPNLPFLAFGAMGAGASFLLWKRDKKEASDIADAEAAEDASKLKKKSAENVMDLLTVEALELEIGYRLVPLIEAEAGGDLLQRITQIRRQMATELGFVLPSIRVRDNLQLPPNTYHIKLKGITLESGEVMSDLWLAMSTDPEVTEPLEGIQTKEPAFGLPATWVYEDQRELAEVSGYTVVSPAAVVATHISEVIKRNAADILNRSDVNELLENVKKTAEPLVSDIIPDPLTAAELHLILQNLLRERVNIRDLPSILEALGYHCRVSKDADYLTEQSRMALSRSICKQYMPVGSQELPVLTLAPELEDQIAQGLTDDGKRLALGPVLVQNLISNISQSVTQAIGQHGTQPVLLCNAKLRLPLYRLIQRTLPLVPVLSYNEVGPSVKANALGVVRLLAGVEAG
jgi:flagellar biosynthesis protein FlhA